MAPCSHRTDQLVAVDTVRKVLEFQQRVLFHTKFLEHRFIFMTADSFYVMHGYFLSPIVSGVVVELSSPPTFPLPIVSPGHLQWTVLFHPPVVRDLDGDGGGLLRTHTCRPAFVFFLAAVVGFTQARVCGLLLFTGQLHSQLLYEHHHRGRDGQGEKCTEDSHQRSAHQEREQDDG